MVPFSSMQTLAAVGLVVATVIALLKGRRRTVRSLRPLPGPYPLPLVGNVLSIDPKKPWITYAEWATRYGDIFMIRVLRQDMIVVNSRKIANELLDRRSSIYSDRPYFALRDPFGWSFNFGWSQCGDEWRLRRKIFEQAFRAKVAVAFQPVQLRKTCDLVLDILRAPHGFVKHIQRFSAAVILSVVYDYEVAPEHDYFVEIIERGISLAMEGLKPETSAIVGAFPFVLSLPEWFPGAVWRRKAAVSKRCAVQMITEPFEHAEKRYAMGSTASAVAFDLLRTHKDMNDLQVLKDVCASAFVAGAETVTATLQTFMLAMLLHPGAQARAQAELDAVIGTDRLPNFEDRPNLPYTEAVLLETLRLYLVGPFGIPHATTTDDIYEGFFIPKGSSVMVNIWAIFHDEGAYPEPNAFKPERFFVDGKLNGEKSIDSGIAFGFGRRVCPGRYVAESSVWAAMVSILWAFKITKSLDARGEEIEFVPTFTHGVTTAPEPFPCAITPRLKNVDIHKLASVDSVEL